MVVTEGKKIEITGMNDQVDQVDSVEPNSIETTDNNVFRKLLVSPFNCSQLPLRKSYCLWMLSFVSLSYIILPAWTKIF